MSASTKPLETIPAPVSNSRVSELARHIGPPAANPGEGIAGACRVFLALLDTAYTLLAVKSYRVPLQLPLPLPVIPCLDHEATIQQESHPHVSVYLQDAAGSLHEITYYPEQCRIVLDLASTFGDSSVQARAQLQEHLAQWFAECQLQVQRISWLRADRRVACTAQAHAPLRDILCEPDLERLRPPLHQLSVIASLIEKNSRVSSWSVRTAYSPLVAAVGVVLYLAMEGAAAQFLPSFWREFVRYGLLASFGLLLVYFGLRAVHLTQIGTRLWKRTEEYRMIVDSRRTLEGAPIGELLARESSRFSDVDLRGDPIALKASWVSVSAERDPALAALARCAERSATATLTAAWRTVRDR